MYLENMFARALGLCSPRVSCHVRLPVVESSVKFEAFGFVYFGGWPVERRKIWLTTMTKMALDEDSGMSVPLRMTKVHESKSGRLLWDVGVAKLKCLANLTLNSRFDAVFQCLGLLVNE